VFREDLFYRLNVVGLRTPPLRERGEDIPLLVSYFLAKFAARVPRRISGISRAARECLLDYDRPGDVRELQIAIESAVVLGAGEEILPDAFRPGLAA
jgi:two-component system response regulator PilR (NtrC family)